MGVLANVKYRSQTKVIDVLLYFDLAKQNVFLFMLNPTKLIGHVLPNRVCAASNQFKKLTFCHFWANVCTVGLHQYIGRKILPVVPLKAKEMQTGITNNHILRNFFILAASIHWWKMVSRTNVLVRYKRKCHVSRTTLYSWPKCLLFISRSAFSAAICVDL